ncbi:hypothetical protein OPQ81_000055 [Rhizoctonia solani]|nr:hypothetical protein OPQ81_000055 [Rhizoctonia solani]
MLFESMILDKILTYASTIAYMAPQKEHSIRDDTDSIKRIIMDVLECLNYLHSRQPEPIVHGSLNAGKIFINEEGRAVIGEFGLSALCYQIALWVPSITFAGFARWMSPELFHLEASSDYSPTLASDIWALACTVLEIISGKLPYANYTHDILIQRAIISGEYPGSYDEFHDTYTPEFCKSMES